MSDAIAIGVIGTGQIGTAHLNRYREVPGVRIAAVCDSNPDAARRAASEFNVPDTYADFRAVLARDDLAAVDVCLHNNLHAPVTIAALEAGKHVFCEKPLAGSFADAQRMCDAAQRTGRKLAMQLNNLFTTETLAAKQLIDDGQLGTLYYAKSCGHRRRGRPFVDGYGTSSFVQRAVAAGGALYDMGVYHISQMLYLLGNPAVLTISGATHQQTSMYEDRRREGKYDVEELALGFVRLAGGITLSIEEAWALHHGSPAGSFIAGARGGLALNPFAYYATLSDMEMNSTFDLAAARTRWERCLPHMHAYKNAQHHWIAALRGDVPLIPSAALGLSMMLIAEGIYLSQQRGAEVTADDVRAASVSTALNL